MKHHYVPQFLLRQWLTDASPTKIHVFTVRSGKLISKPRSPEYTGYENDLYALTHESVAGLGKHDLEEKLFKPIDSDAAVALWKIRDLTALTAYEHRSWTIFLCSLRIRQPDVLDFMRTDAVEHFRSTLAERDRETLADGWESTESWVEQRAPGFVENFGLSQVSAMIEHPEVMKAFGELNWWTYRFKPTDPKLLLSDFPLHFQGGITTPNFFISLPIAPDMVFFGTRIDHTEAQLRSLPSSELAYRINRTSVASASERIWASDRAEAYKFIEDSLPAKGENVETFRALAYRNGFLQK